MRAPTKAQIRHRGARSAMASAMSGFVRSRSLRKRAKHLPGRPAAEPSIVYAERGASLTFSRPNRQNENFSFHRFLRRFYPGFALFAHLHQFQITYYQSVPYLKNDPLPTRLQRLPRQKMAARDPL